jgi:hypothetical protein
MIDVRRVVGIAMLAIPAAYAGVRIVSHVRTLKSERSALLGGGHGYVDDERDFAISAVGGVEVAVCSGKVKGVSERVFFTKVRCLGDREWAYDIGVDNKLKFFPDDGSAMKRAIHRARNHPCFSKAPPKRISMKAAVP